jgi:hypothetical protein
MKRKYFFIIVCIFLFSQSVFTQTTPPEDDVQFWNETSLTFPLIKRTDSNGKESTKLEGFIAGNLRVGQNIKHFTDERIGGGINYKINKYFTASTSYLYAAEQPYKGAKNGYEHRLRFDFTGEKKWKTFSLKDRNRVEYRIRNSRSNSTRYRNKLQLKIPVKSDGKELFAPFVADEVYYDFSKDEWSRNEFSVGISKKINNNFTTEVFYMLQNNTGSVLKRKDIIGLNLKFSIK